MIIDPDRVEVGVDPLKGLMDLLQKGRPAAAIYREGVHMPAKFQFAHRDVSPNYS